MLHIGTTELTLTKQTGMFHCPSCRQSRPYQAQIVRRFLTLYWVPIIPLEELSQHVRCRVCKEKFSQAALAAAAAGTLTRNLDSRSVSRAVILAALRLILVDGRTTRDEIAEVRRLIYDRTGIVATDDDVLAQRSWLAKPESPTAATWLAKVTLTGSRAERAVRDVFLVASAQGDLRPAQLEELAAVPRQLSMKQSQFRRVIQQAVTPTEEPALA
jgi:hypothetical protein